MHHTIYSFSFALDPKSRRYIGRAKSFKARKQHHEDALRRGDHCCVLAQNVFNKYGGDILWEVLQQVPADLVVETEQRYLDDLFRSGKQLNLNRGADTPDYIHLHSAEANKKRSLALKKKWADPVFKAQRIAALKKSAATPESQRQRSALHKGRPVSTEVRKKISDTLKGNTLSEDVRRKISASLKGRTFSDEHKAKLSASSSRPEHIEWARSLGYANRGRKASPEAREKMRAARLQNVEEIRLAQSTCQ